MKKKILLHTCCGPCLSGAVGRLLDSSYDITIFFSNSNISPENEYELRYNNARKVAKHYCVPLVEDSYKHTDWLDFIAGFENEPEKGKRCDLCFRFNLTRAADYAKKESFDFITTTLTISPHKPSDTIFKIGNDLFPFLEIDFKKKDGFKKSIENSKALNLYRQNYCGCEFSKRI